MRRWVMSESFCSLDLRPLCYTALRLHVFTHCGKRCDALRVPHMETKSSYYTRAAGLQHSVSPLNLLGAIQSQWHGGALTSPERAGLLEVGGRARWHIRPPGGSWDPPLGPFQATPASWQASSLCHFHTTAPLASHTHDSRARGTAIAALLAPVHQQAGSRLQHVDAAHFKEAGTRVLGCFTWCCTAGGHSLPTLGRSSSSPQRFPTSGASASLARLGTAV